VSIFRFGPFEVRTDARELYKGGTKVRLRGQPFHILQMLLNNPRKVVTREEMQSKLWPAETFVDFEHGLNVSIRKLRQALSESGHEPRYVETLPGVGYRFIASVESSEEGPIPLAESGNGQSPNAVPDRIADEVDADKDSSHEARSTSPPATPALPTRRSTVPRILTSVLAAAVLVIALSLLLTKPNWRGAQQLAANSPHGPANSVSAAESSQAAVNAGGSATALSLRPGAAASPAFSEIQGKVWVVSIAQASRVAFPPPAATPDATFITKGIAYIASYPNNCYTIATFLTECGTKGFELKFSGIANSNLGGAAARPETAMSGSTWGILIEFTGAASLTNGQPIYILHDDGVALQVDGNLIPGFDPEVTSPTLESVAFRGATRAHSFDLLYANASGGGAWLSFFPALY